MFIKLYVVTLITFFACDMIWLGLVAKNFYAKQIGFLMRTDVNWLPAVIFYLLFILGLILFVISPALEKNSLMYAVSMGALFGLICYATYDLTNLATLKNWPIFITIVDLIWGAVLSALVCFISFLIMTKLK